MIRLDESFDGGSVTLRVGQRIDLALAENASTGYRWHPARPCPPVASPALREIAEAFAAPGRQMPGASGIRLIYFEAVSAGNADLEFEYRRAWQAPAARSFRLRVEIHAE